MNRKRFGITLLLTVSLFGIALLFKAYNNPTSPINNSPHIVRTQVMNEDSLLVDVEFSAFNEEKIQEFQNAANGIADDMNHRVNSLAQPNSSGVDASLSLECDVWWDETTLKVPYLVKGTTTIAKMDVPKIRKHRLELKFDFPSVRWAVKHIGYYPKCDWLKCRKAEIKTKIPIFYKKRVELKFDVPEVYFEYEEIEMDLPKTYTTEWKFGVPKLKCSDLKGEFAEYEEQVDEIVAEGEAELSRLEIQLVKELTSGTADQISTKLDAAKRQIESAIASAKATFDEALADMNEDVEAARAFGREGLLLSARGELERRRDETMQSFRIQLEEIDEQRELLLAHSNDS